MEEIKLHPYEHKSVLIKSTRDWTYNFYKVDKIHRVGYTGKGIKVGLIGTGINWRHKEFNKAFAEDRIEIVDTIGGNGFDGNGHESWCASRFLGERFGMVPDCELISVKAVHDNGAGQLAPVHEGLYYCIDNGCKIISMSLGMNRDEYDDNLFKDIAKYAKDRGVMIFVSAGNDGKLNDLDSPAYLDGFISVGGFDQKMNRSVFSDSGIGLDVYAPGNGKGAYIGQSVAHLSGTSMATPIAAANFALVCPYLIEKTGKADYETLKNIVKCL